MLVYEEALRRIVTEAQPLATEQVSVADAWGRVLAENITATAPQPSADMSAMDGYAVCRNDFVGPAPWRFAVVGESRAGSPLDRLEAGCACRIFTGALLPSGADAVVIQEDVVREGEWVQMPQVPSPGQHVRLRGEDVQQGRTVLSAGTRLNPFQLSLLASVERTQVSVQQRPRVAILSTGSELRAPGAPALPGSIPESNSFALQGLVQAAGGVVVAKQQVSDDLQQTENAVRSLLAVCDLLVTVGGVSVGDHDVVKEALQHAGVTLDFWKVAIKPGKPLAFGKVDKKLVLGLPGNPVSAQVTFCLFGFPLLKRLQGNSAITLPLRRMKLAGALQQGPGRRGYYRVTLSNECATPLKHQASGSACSMAWADGLAVVPEASSGLPEGAEVDVIPFAELW